MKAGQGLLKVHSSLPFCGALETRMPRMLKHDVLKCDVGEFREFLWIDSGHIVLAEYSLTSYFSIRAIRDCKFPTL